VRLQYFGDLRTARAGAWVSPHQLWRVTHIYTPNLPSLFPFTLTYLDGRDRVVGSGGNLGASRRGGTTEFVNETRGGHPSSSSPSPTALPCHSQSYGELVVEEDRARPECIAWHGLARDPFRSVSHCSVRRYSGMPREFQLPSSEGYMAHVTTSTGNYTV